MDNLSCFIVDDDMHSIETIKTYIAQTPQLSFLGAVDSGTAFLQYLREGNMPDLLFLDIEMPQITGLELSDLLAGQCSIVFITAHPRYGADAFDADGVDFLRKPVSYSRFYQAVQKAIRRIAKDNRAHSRLLSSQQMAVAEEASAQSGPPASMLFKEDIFFVYSKERGTNDLRRLSELIYIKALDTYVQLFFSGERKNIFHRSLNSVERELPASFIRVHRSYIINTAFIRSVTATEIFLNEIGEAIPLGKLYRQNLREFVESRTLGNEY